MIILYIMWLFCLPFLLISLKDYIRVYQDSTTTHAEPVDSGKTDYFPNPFDSELSIHLGEIPQKDVHLRIYDINSLISFLANFNERAIEFIKSM